MNHNSLRKVNKSTMSFYDFSRNIFFALIIRMVNVNIQHFGHTLISFKNSIKKRKSCIKDQHAYTTSATVNVLPPIKIKSFFTACLRATE